MSNPQGNPPSSPPYGNQAYGQWQPYGPQPYVPPGPAMQGPPPENNLGWAIGALLMCWPFGIPALIKSTEVRKFWTQGLQQESERSAAEAKKWGKIGVIVGGCILGVSLLFAVAMVAISIATLGTIGAAGTS